MARRGHELILVARSREKLDSLAERITEHTGRSVEVIVADLNDNADQARIEDVLHTNARITLLLNNDDKLQLIDLRECGEPPCLDAHCLR